MVLRHDWDRLLLTAQPQPPSMRSKYGSTSPANPEHVRSFRGAGRRLRISQSSADAISWVSTWNVIDVPLHGTIKFTPPPTCPLAPYSLTPVDYVGDFNGIYLTTSILFFPQKWSLPLDSSFRKRMWVFAHPRSPPHPTPRLFWFIISTSTMDTLETFAWQSQTPLSPVVGALWF